MANKSRRPSEESLSKKTLLLTKAVVPFVDDETSFPWAPGVWLTYHEALRRELTRLVRALNSFDPLNEPWKSIALYRWLMEFLIPVLQHNERGKRLFTKPMYESKGYEIPKPINYSEDFLSTTFEQIAFFAKECLDLSLSDNLFPSKIRDSVANLRQHGLELSEILNAQYDAEERFWIPTFEKEGLEVWNKVLHRMLLYNRRINAKISNVTFAMVFHAIGYNLTCLSAADPLDTPWCGPRTRFTFVKKAPFIVKALPLVKWMGDYLKFKAMINAVYFLTDDEHDYEKRFRLERVRQERRADRQLRMSRWYSQIFVHTDALSRSSSFGSPSMDDTDDKDRSTNSGKLKKQQSLLFAPEYQSGDEDFVYPFEEQTLRSSNVGENKESGSGNNVGRRLSYTVDGVEPSDGHLPVTKTNSIDNQNDRITSGQSSPTRLSKQRSLFDWFFSLWKQDSRAVDSPSASSSSIDQTKTAICTSSMPTIADAAVVDAQISDDGIVPVTKSKPSASPDSYQITEKSSNNKNNDAQNSIENKNIENSQDNNCSALLVRNRSKVVPHE